MDICVDLIVQKNQILGIRTKPVNLGFEIIAVNGGEVERWNHEHTTARRVVAGDIVVAANGHSVAIDPSKTLASYAVRGGLQLQVRKAKHIDVHLHVAGVQTLGVRTRVVRRGLEIVAVNPGVLQQWHLAHSSMSIDAGDVITAANGQDTTTVPDKLLMRYAADGDLRLRVQKGGAPDSCESTASTVATPRDEGNYFTANLIVPETQTLGIRTQAVPLGLGVVAVNYGAVQHWNQLTKITTIDTGDIVLTANGCNVADDRSKTLVSYAIDGHLELRVRKADLVDMNLNVLNDQSLGIRTRASGGGLEVRRVHEGIIQEWNRMHPYTNIEAGDSIVTANGHSVAKDLKKTVVTYASDNKLHLQVQKGMANIRSVISVGKVTLFTVNVCVPQSRTLGITYRHTSLGMEVVSVNPGVLHQWNEEHSLERIVAGDIIVEANGHRISTNVGKKLASYVVDDRLRLQVRKGTYVDMNLRLCQDEMIGVTYRVTPLGLEVVDVHHGAILQWNEAHAYSKVDVGDFVVAANGHNITEDQSKKLRSYVVGDSLAIRVLKATCAAIQ